jgi:hypothetical protein
MFVFDTDHTTESPALDRLLREWWAKVWAWLRGQPLLEGQGQEQMDERDSSAGLIL